MLGNSQVAAQLVASRVVLSSIELFIYLVSIHNVYTCIHISNSTFHFYFGGEGGQIAVRGVQSVQETSRFGTSGW
jgi:hypothetical protein